MANSSKKMKIGRKIQQWQEEMNREFGSSLLPAPSILIEEAKQVNTRNVSDGQIRLEKIKIRIQQMSIIKHSDIYVQRIDAGFGNSLQCTWPSCNKISNSAQHLYICRFHRKRMQSHLTNMCSDNGVVINRSYSSRDFEGYTSLIELFESAISIVYQGGTTTDAFHSQCRLLQDTFLNIRNFLIITSTMIKPNEELLESMLPQIMGTALMVVKTWARQSSITNIVGFMKCFIEHTLFFFGIINPWETLFPDSKSYVQIGRGVGGMLGVLSLSVVGPVGAVALMGAGSLSGGLIANTWYIKKKRMEMIGESYCRYLNFRYIQQNYQDVDSEDYEQELYCLSGNAYIDALLIGMIIVLALLLLNNM